MHSTDKKSVRTRIGSFELNKKKYDVLKPTLKQILTHTVEQEEAFKEMEKLIKKDDKSELIKCRMSWLIREMRIFFPEMSEEDAGDMDEKQHNDILKMLWETSEVEMPEVKTSGGKKKAQRGGK